MLRLSYGAPANPSRSKAEQHGRPVDSAVSSAAMSIQQPVTSLKPMLVVLRCSPEDVGQPIDMVLHPEVQLMQQHLTLNSRQLTLVVPRSIDAILDMYIARSELFRKFELAAAASGNTCLSRHHFRCSKDPQPAPLCHQPYR